MTEIAGVQIPISRVSTAVRVMLDGYKINGGIGLSTIKFCEAQIAYMIDNGIQSFHPIIQEYRNQIELERGRV